MAAPTRLAQTIVAHMNQNPAVNHGDQASVRDIIQSMACPRQVDAAEKNVAVKRGPEAAVCPRAGRQDVDSYNAAITGVRHKHSTCSIARSACLLRDQWAQGPDKMTVATSGP